MPVTIIQTSTNYAFPLNSVDFVEGDSILGSGQHRNAYVICTTSMVSQGDYECLRKRRVSVDEKEIVFTDEITLNVSKDGEYYKVDCSELKIEAVEEERAGAIEMLYYEILYLWEDYALEKDENLTPDGRELKNRVLRLIEEVK